jgi:DNA-binding MarR family transcriptional regulator
MHRETMADLVAFLAVARERSFTRAAAKLGVSPSALSHTIRKLEERLGVRLLTRTSRSVSTTEPGERLLERVGPHFDQVADELDGLTELRDKPAGTLRITTGDQPAESILLPALAKLLPIYPDLSVELVVDKEKKTPLPAAADPARRVFDRAWGNGLVIRAFANGVLGYAPPLCCTDADIDAIIERTRKTLDDTLADPDVRAALKD